jgi:hypothetical protein
VAEVLRAEVAPDAPERVWRLVCGEGASPLRGLISGSLDLDKIEYLKRDALMCGVPYGEIDVDRLINNLAVVELPPPDAPGDDARERGRDDVHGGRPSRGVALREKGLPALESLLFAKYQMYRNVYWHHAVRSATAMYKRLVDDVLRAGTFGFDVDGAAPLAAYTDEGLLHALDERAPAPATAALLAALRARRLHKRVVECPAATLGDGEADWIADDRALAVAAEDALARELGLAPGELLLDYPAKTQMLGLDLPVLRRGGRVERLTEAGLDGAINLPRLAEQLYRSARWLRVFAARPVAVDRSALTRALRRPAADVRAALAEGRPLLARA